VHFPSFTSIQHPPFFTIQMQVSNRPLTIFVKTFYPLIDLQLENLVIFHENRVEIAHYITSLLIWTMSCMCPRICCLFRIFVLVVDDLKLILTLPFSTLLNLLKIHTDHRTLNEMELWVMNLNRLKQTKSVRYQTWNYILVFSYLEIRSPKVRMGFFTLSWLIDWGF